VRDRETWGDADLTTGGAWADLRTGMEIKSHDLMMRESDVQDMAKVEDVCICFHAWSHHVELC